MVGVRGCFASQCPIEYRIIINLNFDTTKANDSRAAHWAGVWSALLANARPLTISGFPHTIHKT